MRTCTKCKITKELSAFYKSKDSKDGVRSVCKECSSGIDKVRNRKYYSEHKEERANYTRAHRGSTPRRKLSEEERKSAALTGSRNWRKNHKEEKAISNRTYQTQHPEIMREIKRRRRARIKGQLGFVFPGMEKLLLLIQEENCYYCGENLNGNYHMDHKIPLYRGGLHAWENVCLACPSCNLKKNTKTDLEFLSKIS